MTAAAATPTGGATAAAAAEPDGHPSWGLYGGMPPDHGGPSDTLQLAGQGLEQHEPGFGASGFGEGRVHGGGDELALLGLPPLEHAQGGDFLLHGVEGQRLQGGPSWQTHGSDRRPLTLSALMVAGALSHLPHVTALCSCRALGLDL